jgi:hypothetical protein
MAPRACGSRRLIFDVIREMKVAATSRVNEFINRNGLTKSIHTPMAGSIGLNDCKVRDSTAASTIWANLSLI